MPSQYLTSVSNLTRLRASQCNAINTQSGLGATTTDCRGSFFYNHAGLISAWYLPAVRRSVTIQLHEWTGRAPSLSLAS